MSWGYRIVVVFILFAGFMFFLVYKSMHQRVDLVSENYYEQELKYQDKINKQNNAGKLKEDVKVYIEAEKIHIEFPSEFKDKITGEIYFFRPSDYRLDYKLKIETDTLSRQIIEKKTLQKGFYKVKIEWSSKNIDFYSEKVLNIL